MSEPDKNQCQNFLKVEVEPGAWQFQPCKAKPLFIVTQISTGRKKSVCRNCLIATEKIYAGNILKESI